MGKTPLSYALAKALGLSYNRIQGTSDLLPADILGILIFNQTTSEFLFILALYSVSLYSPMR